MIVEPYKVRPVAPIIALLTDDGEAIDENGEVLSFDRWPSGVRLWGSYDTVYKLVREGKGEALCWNNEEIRWRHNKLNELEWKKRVTDCNVIRLPFNDVGISQALRSFSLWRDWLQSYGASPTGTSGSAAWSLLRARLQRRLVTGCGERPPIKQTIGGRQELGPGGQGSFTGEIAHIDLPAAYASTLASLRYGGWWLKADGSPGRRWQLYAETDSPVYLRAKITIPSSLPYGPLVRRPRKPVQGYLDSVLRGSAYPRGVTIQGVWTVEEIMAAERFGCRINRVIEGWVHRSGWHPFERWWEAILEGREMGGLAGQLAKMTGNALWGRFCMDVKTGGRRSIRTQRGSKLVSRELPQRPSMFPAHHLAETVSGRVRARLFTAMMQCDELMAAHTDGLWARGPVSTADDGWRVKERARQIDILSPQQFRYWPTPASEKEPFVVFAGIPSAYAEKAFERSWEKANAPEH